MATPFSNAATDQSTFFVEPIQDGHTPVAGPINRAAATIQLKSSGGRHTKEIEDYASPQPEPRSIPESGHPAVTVSGVGWSRCVEFERGAPRHRADVQRNPVGMLDQGIFEDDNRQAGIEGLFVVPIIEENLHLSGGGQIVVRGKVAAEEQQRAADEGGQRQA